MAENTQTQQHINAVSEAEAAVDEATVGLDHTRDVLAQRQRELARHLLDVGADEYGTAAAFCRAVHERHGLSESHIRVSLYSQPTKAVLEAALDTLARHIHPSKQAA